MRRAHSRRAPAALATALTIALLDASLQPLFELALQPPDGAAAKIDRFGKGAGGNALVDRRSREARKALDLAPSQCPLHIASPASGGHGRIDRDAKAEGAASAKYIGSEN